MTRRRSPLVLLLVLPVLGLVVPAYGQDADTTEADGPAPDTTRAVPADTAVADTTGADTPTADTAQVSVTPDTLTTDTMAVADTAAVDTAVADTALSAAARRERAKEQARAAAEAWLSLTDSGQFGASWDEAASTLQRSVSREAWQKRGAQARSTLQSPTERTLTRTEYRDSTAQLPGGRPVVALQYRTRFEGRSALEAVITTKQDAGWKVAGYRVVPAPTDSTQAPDTTQAQSPPDTTKSP